MKKLVKTFLPPFIGFTVYFLAIRYSSLYFALRLDEMGEGTIKAFMAYYRYLMPLLFAVAVLTQLLIVVPIWDKVSSAGAKISSWVALVLICLVFAGGISYIIWDKQTGKHHLVNVTLFLTGIQLGYWVINFLILYILEERSNETPDITDTDE